MEIQATNDFVWVKKDVPRETSGELWIPTQGREKPHSGTVLSIGDTVKDKKIKASKGKKCLWHATTGTVIEYEDEEYFVLESIHIIGIV